MKKLVLIFAACLFAASLYAQEKTELLTEPQNEELLDPVTGFPLITEKPFVVFNEGFSYATVTRLIKNEDRNNYVWNDQMVGAYFQLQSGNMKPCNSLIQLSAYYPMVHSFNSEPQIPKQTILYAFDLFAGPFIEADMWKYVRIKFGAGLHYMYQLSDEWHLNYLGVGALTGIELPVSKGWNVLVDGTFSVDNANFGSNKLMQPFDYSWQYHLNAGVRYSKHHKNKYSYIDSKPKTPQTQSEESE